jgi:PAS domain S-box-containing protein
MKKTLRCLLVEDSETDAELLVRHLEECYIVHFRRVQEASSLAAALGGEPWDVVLCDYWMPGFGFLPALEVVRQTNLELPFIVVSGSLGEERAVEAMRAGAHDYFMKDKLTRLLPAIEREIQQAQARRERTRHLHRAAWLAAIVDSMGEAVIGTDLHGDITSWNAGAEKLYGFRTDQALGQPAELVVPADLQGEVRRILQSVRQEGRVAEFETTLRLRRKGTPVEVSSAVSAVKDDQGRIIGAAILALDITERKQAEAERQNLIRQLNETLAQIRRLQGLLPICAACKKIRDEHGNWQGLESYISGHSEAQFSHSICPGCAQTLYPEYSAKT